ncbi:SDR family NAD(P)-dependent oxidoreductase [Salinibacterium sp. G-O1]|uniref:SDR family NAD(P)-dependent oxidoreductase n=1 Tax=Salinibacterium sp. G-O1 TaxID=3046208 RepID=UPI0024BB4534|nr:SDR family NAD(P)-dependent oxidoreductase [Salinibacterium sp. G-O1]MDJ0335614.1 SDR family NAD(P)-dependent oxidoreductase [Salinibacterium sp. G-O1]
MTNPGGAIVLVVGATGGLGSLISEQLEQAGATVLRSGRTTKTLAADLRAGDAAAQLIEAAVAVHGRLDGLVIAAGVVAFGPATELSDATLRELFDVNALAPVRLIRAAAPHLTASAQSGGEPFVVTLSGVVSETPTAGLAAYSASKAALAAFMQATSRELRRASIRLIDARPGHTDTALSTHPIQGAAPAFPAGLAPEAVAARIVRAIIDGEKDLPSGAF